MIVPCSLSALMSISPGSVLDKGIRRILRAAATRIQGINHAINVFGS